MSEHAHGPDLVEFWLAMTDRQIAMTAPKVAEYGSRDLVDIGREVLSLAGRDTDDDRLAFEAGVFFYVRGKVARWAAAVHRGEPVSKDTLDDIIIYSTLVLHDREGE
jgi:hypothetical protein